MEGERSHHYTNPCPKPLLFAPLVIVRDKQTVHSGVGGKQTVHSGVGEGTRIKGQGCLLFLLWASKVVFTYIHTYTYMKLYFISDTSEIKTGKSLGTSGCSASKGLWPERLWYFLGY